MLLVVSYKLLLMQYQVPQFIETEDKIIGGVLTLKQFLIIAAAAGLSFLFYFIFASLAWILLTSVVGIIAIFIAFVKIQGRSVPTLVVAAFSYYWQPRFYLWQSEKPESETAFLEAKTLTAKKAEPKEFVFHRKAKSDVPSLEPVLPTDWRGSEPASSLELSTAPPAAESTFKRADKLVIENEKAKKEALAALEEQLLKKEELLEHEVEELRNSKARLEAEMKKIIESRNLTSMKAARPALTMPDNRAVASPSRNRASVAEEKPKLPADVKETPSIIREKLAVAGKVQDLLQRILTSKTSIPKREKKLFNFGKISKERYELLRRATGEIEPARRVDYGNIRR